MSIAVRLSGEEINPAPSMKTEKFLDQRDKQEHSQLCVIPPCHVQNPSEYAFDVQGG